MGTADVTTYYSRQSLTWNSARLSKVFWILGLAHRLETNCQTGDVDSQG